MAMLVVLAAVLLTYGVFAGNAMGPAKIGAGIGRAVGLRIGGPPGGLVGAAFGTLHGAGTGSHLPLDMALNSVDNMYSGCKDKMLKKAPEYLKNEKNTNNKFRDLWDTEMANIDKTGTFGTLSKEQLVAIRVYTAASENLYIDFNNAVRVQGPHYKDLFGFHALHFYLTTAIQTLKDPSTDKDRATVYRRSNLLFQQDVVGTEIRFGSFTSTSLDGYLDPSKFGDKSCFKIVTCMGADISKYSLNPDEREVLIPPYEVFKVVEVKDKSQHPDLPCEVEYTLESTGKPYSNLDCALIE